MSVGPIMVAVQERRSEGELGKAEILGVGESMSCINSVWRLGSVRCKVIGRGGKGRKGKGKRGGYRLVTLWFVDDRTEGASLEDS